MPAKSQSAKFRPFLHKTGMFYHQQRYLINMIGLQEKTGLKFLESTDIVVNPTPKDVKLSYFRNM